MSWNLEDIVNPLRAWWILRVGSSGGSGVPTKVSLSIRVAGRMEKPPGSLGSCGA